MIKLSKRDFTFPQGHSSKGNQFKWLKDNIWYKADYLGYESLAETVVSELLGYSNISEFVRYELTRIEWEDKEYKACRSISFLKPGEEIWTCERLYSQFFGGSLAGEMAGMDTEEKIRFFVDIMEEITGVENFGRYLTLLLEIDGLILNEDRHTHNIALIKDRAGRLRTCPVFDNGAALFSDMRSDYPLELPLEECFRKIKAKPFSTDFDEQMDCAETLFGQQLKMDFRGLNIGKCMEKYRACYGKEICDRVEETIRRQIRKYSYFGYHKA